MHTLRQSDESAENPARRPLWLPALEQELRSRVGWVDEAVSPFAAETHAAQTLATIPDTFQPGKAA